MVILERNHTINGNIDEYGAHMPVEKRDIVRLFEEGCCGAYDSDSGCCPWAEQDEPKR